MTQLSSFLFPLTYTLFILPGWLPIPYHNGLPVRVGLSLYLDLFFLCCDSRPLFPHPLALPVSVCKWWHCGKTIVKHPGSSPVCPSYAPSSIHTGFTPITPCIDSHTHLAQSRLSPAYIPSRAHTHIITHKNEACFISSPGHSSSAALLMLKFYEQYHYAVQTHHNVNGNSGDWVN